MQYGIANESDVIASVDGDVLETILILALDHARLLHDDKAADAIQDLNAALQVAKEKPELEYDVHVNGCLCGACIHERENEERRESVRRSYVALVKMIGAGFHPETRGADYVSLPSPLTAERVDAIIDDAYDWGVDVHGIALDTIHAMDERPAGLDA